MFNEFVKSLQHKDAALKIQRDELIAELNRGSQRLQALNGAIAGIEQLLLLEGVTPGEEPESEEEFTLDSGITLAGLLKTIMIKGAAYETEQLIAMVKQHGYNFHEKNPTRAVNFTLMGMRRSGHYVRDDSGRWRFIG